MISRNIEDFVLQILHSYNKICFISGPRQSGKTTFSKMILEHFQQSSYINWDIINHQKKIIKDPYFFENENRDLQKRFLVVFDEIHKYKDWKNYLKGCYDGYKDDFNFLVTGSGRLDLFKKGGDSLFGRYFAVNLFPFTLGELENKKFISWDEFEQILLNGFELKSFKTTYEQLWSFSGFPEPFLKNNIEFYNIWANERKKTVIKEDIRDAYYIKDISNIEILSTLLPFKVGSPLSVNSIREDLNVAFDSIKKWLLILEQFYYIFTVKPYSKSLPRAIKKENKVYLYDWVEIEDNAAKFENLVALHLFKTITLWTQTGKGNFDLYYLRDKEKREVDFLVTKDNQLLFLVEVKLNDTDLSKNLLYFQEKLKVPYAIQVVSKSGVLKKLKRNNYVQYIISADNFLYYLL
ncbi:ATPase, AAA family [Deferribacter desulfuricans SSM1]|uniref:ATPase, AAA family n=1 Tax=Deferribacter desulfuricans (strain DSM 14783 / JCM 11476 / NBRC 101012 / SSM1) TaxID=639282 RepID=D3P9T2_DEFDS|nr:ATP-binding protein [Deferribacter desulfuricans]BAI81472.1 ATPase, AAA family [Deferribacter desulfuricans SSM1]